MQFFAPRQPILLFCNAWKKYLPCQRNLVQERVRDQIGLERLFHILHASHPSLQFLTQLLHYSKNNTCLLSHWKMLLIHTYHLFEISFVCWSLIVGAGTTFMLQRLKIHKVNVIHVHMAMFTSSDSLSTIGTCCQGSLKGANGMLARFLLKIFPPLSKPVRRAFARLTDLQWDTCLFTLENAI